MDKEKPRNMVSKSIYLTEEQDVALKALHDRTRIPVAVLVREGIDLLLAKYSPAPEIDPRQLPLLGGEG